MGRAGKSREVRRDRARRTLVCTAKEVRAVESFGTLHERFQAPSDDK